MKTFAYDEMPAYIRKLMVGGTEVLNCRSRIFPNGPAKKFIRLTEDVCYKQSWHGGSVMLQKGSYLHADPSDIYGLTEETFNRCYIPQ